MKSGLHVEVRLETGLCLQEVAPDTPAATDGQPELEVFVIFTDYSGTLAALQMADQLTQRLEARLRFLLPFEVPYALPLTKPAVSVEYLEGQIHALASKIPINIAAHIYLCRDKRRTLRLILKPGSIVILGGKKWWWTAEQKLARALKKDGHHVIFVESR